MNERHGADLRGVQPDVELAPVTDHVNVMGVPLEY
jgi:hypothetical protein